MIKKERKGKGWRSTFGAGKETLATVEGPDLEKAKTEADEEERVASRKVDRLEGSDGDVLLWELLTRLDPEHNIRALLLVIEVPDADCLD